MPVLNGALTGIGGGNSSFAKKEEDEDDIYKALLALDGDTNRVPQLRYWLAWRAFANIYDEDGDLIYFTADLAGRKVPPQKFPCQAFESIFIKLKQLRKSYQEILDADRESSNIRSLKRRWKCLRVGQDAYQLWLDATSQINTIIRPDIQSNNPGAAERTSFTFGDRWAIDVYAELSLFAIKCLVEGKAFEYATKVADISVNLLSEAITFLSQIYKNQDTLPLGQKVAMHQLSSLYAWHSYALYMEIHDVPTQARLRIFGEKINLEKQLDQIDTCIHHASDITNYHPLTIYTQSLLFKKLGLFKQAANELSRLSTIIAPFDPHQFTHSETVKLESLEIGSTTSLIDITPSILYKREQINGRRQFEFVVNIVRVHIGLANIFVAQEEMNLVIEHMVHAISKSLYRDLTAKLYLELAYILTQQGKFDEAISATEEAKSRYKHLSIFKKENARCIQPFILECILRTNIENYPSALEKAGDILAIIDQGNYLNVHAELVDEIIRDYGIDTIERLNPFKPFLQTYKRKISRAIKSNNMEDIADLASRCLRPDLLESDLRKIHTSGDSDTIEVVFTSQVLSLLARDMFDQLVYWCDIHNNIAFNFAQLNMDLDLAEKYAGIAISNMNNLLANFDPTLDIEFSSTGNESNTEKVEKRLQNILDPLSRITTNYEDRMANYLDTQSWVLFRKGKLKNYYRAFNTLSNEAMQYGANLPILHYHLARICISIIEETWLEIQFSNTGKAKISNSKAARISEHLRLALLYWREASRLDYRQTLSSRLLKVKQQLDVFREKWSLINLPEDIRNNSSHL